MRHITRLKIVPHGSRKITACFKRSGRGAKLWQFIVDAFGDELSAARAARGREWTPPQRGRSLGQGLQVEMGRSLYREIREKFVEVPEVSSSLADGSFVIEDDWFIQKPPSQRGATGNGFGEDGS